MDFLCGQTESDVYAAVLEQGAAFRAVAKGYALGSGNSIPDSVPADAPANLHLLDDHDLLTDFSLLGIDLIHPSPAFGALFETWGVTKCYKQVQRQALPPVLHHYRQHSGAEIDLILERDGKFFPIEVKASSKVGPMDARSIGVFGDKFGDAAMPGLIVYGGRRVLKLADHCVAVPFDLV